MNTHSDCPVPHLTRLNIWRATQGENVDPPEDLLHNYPAIQTCWIDACAYCMWLTEKTGVPFRLPTQAEWEYACTAGGKEPANRLTPTYRMFYRSNYVAHRVGFRIVCSKDPSHLLAPKSIPEAEE